VIAKPMTSHACYAASRINLTLKGSTKQFGTLQAPATIRVPSPGSNPESVELWNICHDLADWESSKIVL
jgi:hypothetical protein